VSARRLIVNADDFGLSAGVDRGIAEAHEHGIVTSASLMVRGGHATEAAAYARDHPALSVGLHVDLAEWRHTGHEWVAEYEVVPPADAVAVAEEVRAQLERFVALVGRAPTHLDSHQHVHREDPARMVVLEQARRLGVPVRELTTEIRFVGGFYGQSGRGEPWSEGVGVEALEGLLRGLPPGTSELGCHPGLGGDSGSPYSRERTLETTTLCDERVLATLRREGIELCSFNEWRPCR
jgi:predicted glycoside hydrolase/deacetylase ChbG (UPF0249 family)